MKKLATRCLSLALALVMLVCMSGVAENAQYSFLTNIDAVCGYLNQFYGANVSYVADEDGCTQVTVSLSQNGMPLVENFVAQIAEDALTFGADGQLFKFNEQTVQEFAEIIVPQLIALAAGTFGQTADGENMVSPELLTAVIDYLTGGAAEHDLNTLSLLLEREANRFAQVAAEQGVIVISENGDITITVTVESLARLLVAYAESFASDEAAQPWVSGLEIWTALNVPAEQVQAVIAQLPAAITEIASQLTASGLEGEFTLHILASGSADLLLTAKDAVNSLKIAAEMTAEGLFGVSADVYAEEETLLFAASNQNEEGAVVTDTTYVNGETTLVLQTLAGSERAVITANLFEGETPVASFDFYGDSEQITASLESPVLNGNLVLTMGEDALEFSANYADAEGTTGEAYAKIDAQTGNFIAYGSTALADGTVTDSFKIDYENGTLNVSATEADENLTFTATETDESVFFAFDYASATETLTGEGAFGEMGGEFTFDYASANAAVAGAFALDAAAEILTFDAAGTVEGEDLTAHVVFDAAQRLGQISVVIGDLELNGTVSATEEDGTITVIESLTASQAGEIISLYEVVETVAQTEEGIAINYTMKSIDVTSGEKTAVFTLLGTDFTFDYADSSVQISATGALTALDEGMGYVVNGTLTQNGETTEFSGTIGTHDHSEGGMNVTEIFVEYALNGMQMGHYGLELGTGTDENGANVYSASVHTLANDVKTVIAYATVTIAQSIVESPAHLEGIQLRGTDILDLISGFVG